MHLRTEVVIAIGIACVLTRGALAQAPAGASNAVGMWHGTSVCMARSSPCRDEIVVYRVSRGTASDSVSVDARKIVNGAEVEMGVLGCVVGARGAQLTCTVPNGTLRFAIRGDSLVGNLKLPDNTTYRDVRATRTR